MDKVRLLEEIMQRNAVRRMAQLPLLDVRAELDHACAVARYAEWLAFCEEKSADLQRIEAEVLTELRATRGPHFPSNAIAAIAVHREVETRFEAYAAIHYGVQMPRYATRHPIIYGEANEAT